MRTKSGVLSIVALLFGLLGVQGSAAEAAECLRYGDVVTLRFNRNDRSMVAEDNGAVSINRVQPFLHWGRFLLVDPSNLSNSGAIPTAGAFALRSYKHNNYLRADPDASVRADSRALTQSSRWRLSTSSGGACFSLNSFNEVEGLLRVENGTRAVEPGTAPGYAAVTVPVLGLTNASDRVVLKRRFWTNFYYDIPWQDPGPEQLCPYRGRWDGTNCFVAEITYGQPFIWRGNFYGVTAGWAGNPAGCGAAGWFDGAHCQLGVNPPGSHTPFMYQNSWYLGKGLYEDMSCVSAQESSLFGDFKACAKAGSIQIGSYPMRQDPSFPFNPTNPIGHRLPVPLSDISHFRICYKKTFTIQGICHNQLIYSGKHVTVISGLQSNQTYKVRAYYTAASFPGERWIGQIHVDTH